MVKLLCPYDKKPCDPACVLHVPPEPDKAAAGDVAAVPGHAEYCRKFGLVNDGSG